MKIKTLEVAGLLPSLKGMRNPKNSWHLSDSYKCDEFNCNGGKCPGFSTTQCIAEDGYVIGPNDLKLCHTLIGAGSEHRKFLRQIQVWADIDMPRYWWSEMDTYHHNTKNSCSTMHKLFEKGKEIAIEQFIYCIEDESLIRFTVRRLNNIREEWMEATTQTEKDYCLLRAKRILPEGFLQLRTISTNYEELRSMYFQRHNHRLQTEWGQVFCNWVESLPYARELILYSGK